MKFFSICLALALACLPARAEPLQVMDLRLQPDSAWQRGTPQQEREDDALVLSWPVPEGVALQVLVPREPPLLKSDPDTFYRHLTRKWSTLYGKQAAVGWVEAGPKGPGGIRWLSCRRPASTGDGVVFHLATVHEGRAYSLLAFAPPGTGALPEAVHRLVASAGFQALPSVWRQAHALALAPRGDVLEALAQAEAEALGDRGMITGYGASAEAPTGESAGKSLALHWFIEGFHWDKQAGRDGRMPFETRGQLVAEAPLLLEEGTLRLGLKLGGADGALSARVRMHTYCGPSGPWEEALADLARGARGPLGRLARDHACPSQPAKADLATLEAVPGQTVARSVPLGRPEGRVDRLWLEIRLLPRAGAAGEGVLDRQGLYFVYEPED